MDWYCITLSLKKFLQVNELIFFALEETVLSCFWNSRLVPQFQRSDCDVDLVLLG